LLHLPQGKSIASLKVSVAMIEAGAMRGKSTSGRRTLRLQRTKADAPVIPEQERLHASRFPGLHLTRHARDGAKRDRVPAEIRFDPRSAAR